MDAIVAVYSDWGIGCGGTQPVVIGEDRKRFKEITGTDTVIVGRRTLEDFPGGKPLKNRRNIVITTQNIDIEGAEIAHSPQEAVRLAGGGAAHVIGGGSIYEAMLEYCDSVYVTKIKAKPDSDTFFPNLDEHPGWFCAEPGEDREQDGIKYRFTLYKRK